MKIQSAEKMIREIFSSADVAVNGNRPWDIQVKNKKFYNRLATGGSLALGEAYMDGWWQCRQLDQFFDRILAFRIDHEARHSLVSLLCSLKSALSLSTGWFPSFSIGRRHYDIGNELFIRMLDKWMNYSCAYWKNVSSLDMAQEAKMELICQKLQLEPGMKVLDIGCGWGGLSAYMAKNYDVSVTGVTVSREQAKLASQRCKKLPVDIRLMDYRKLKGRFDRIVSVGMFEHVGVGSYPVFMKKVSQSLKPQGLFLLHTIGGNRSKRCSDPWITRYIFPNSMIPSSRQITDAAEHSLILEDWHSMGPDYDPTLMAWYKNFTDNWDEIRQHYDQRFYRMWTYYLLACAGSFRARRNQLWQVVFSKEGLRHGYTSVR